MIYAIPCVNGKLCMHFGHCQEFVMVDADNTTKKIIGTKNIVPPAHEPGVLPRWLHEQGANVIIAGGMGTQAQSLFQQNGISVVTGVESGFPEDLVNDYMQNTLKAGSNTCDH